MLQCLFTYTFQTTIICAAGANSLAASLKLGDEPSAFLYGTNSFPTQGAGTNFFLSHYAYTGAVCDCATSGAVESGAPCQDGWDEIFCVIV